MPLDDYFYSSFNSPTIMYIPYTRKVCGCYPFGCINCYISYPCLNCVNCHPDMTMNMSCNTFLNHMRKRKDVYIPKEDETICQQCGDITETVNFVTNTWDKKKILVCSECIYITKNCRPCEDCGNLFVNPTIYSDSICDDCLMYTYDLYRVLHY